jgi:hypothetical protein
MYEHKARAYEWHARTLALVGKPDEAREAATTALSIYEAKGDVPASAWARAGRVTRREVLNGMDQNGLEPRIDPTLLSPDQATNERLAPADRFLFLRFRQRATIGPRRAYLRLIRQLIAPICRHI